MASPTNKLLVVGAALSGLAALMHLACLAVGAPLFRLLGAGEQMAQLHLAGHWYPTVVTLAIAGVLAAWSAYALSGAGVIRKLPLRRAALSAITAIYIVRGAAFAPAMTYFPGNSTTFWIVSSSICLLIGIVHLVGLWQSWGRLSGGNGMDRKLSRSWSPRVVSALVVLVAVVAARALSEAFALNLWWTMALAALLAGALYRAASFVRGTA